MTVFTGDEKIKITLILSIRLLKHIEINNQLDKCSEYAMTYPRGTPKKKTHSTEKLTIQNGWVSIFTYVPLARFEMGI